MSELQLLLQNKSLKAKEKSGIICGWLLEGKLSSAELAQVAVTQKEPDVANCLEGLEKATRPNPELAGHVGIEFAISCLGAKAPRVKWESARVLANCLQLYPDYAAMAITPLLANTQHSGTVVRWSAAVALRKIVDLPGRPQADLLAALRTLQLNEENNGVRKIYEEALKGK